jgi:phosphatidylethanolamine/phosphatidyl-N-methylethanolamine N-methyltransferase
MSKRIFLQAPNLVESFYKNHYTEYLYSGLQGFTMATSHRLMEIGVDRRTNSNCLEIGGGLMPHFLWMDFQEITNYTISDNNTTNVQQLKSKLRSHFDVEFHDRNADPSLSRLSGQYTRIIASHVLEHIENPEETILRWISLLDGDGIISISLPCDPGWLWRCAQFMSCRKFIRLTGTSFQEYELISAREHVSSVQRLLKIIRYYFEKYRIIWFPSLLPVVDFNLFCIITLTKSEFNPR